MGGEEGAGGGLASEDAAPKRRRRSDKDDEDENAEVGVWLRLRGLWVNRVGGGAALGSRVRVRGDDAPCGAGGQQFWAVEVCGVRAGGCPCLPASQPHPIACTTRLSSPSLPFPQEEEEYQEGKLRFTGGRGEQATYGAGEAAAAGLEKLALACWEAAAASATAAGQLPTQRQLTASPATSNLATTATTLTTPTATATSLGDEDDVEIQHQIDREARRRHVESEDDEGEQGGGLPEGGGQAVGLLATHCCC